jgi:hypothetical protein
MRWPRSRQAAEQGAGAYSKAHLVSSLDLENTKQFSMTLMADPTSRDMGESAT